MIEREQTFKTKLLVEMDGLKVTKVLSYCGD